jgi:hemerythrin-like domain-containing protein
MEKMGIQIGARPDCGFEDPLGMLKDCHRRVERFLQILWLVARQAQGRACTDEERFAVESAFSYFRTGGQRHTADEEESLFPRLRAVSAADAFKELDALESDHDAANRLHDDLESLYAAWFEAGHLNSADGQKILGITERLKNLYAKHIDIEERLIFPRAAEILDRQSIAAIGTEFRNRRA